MKKVVTFGEIMLRLAPPGFLRFSQTTSFDVIYGGGESNVAVSLANYGVDVDFVTRLPNNDIGQCAMMELRKRGVGVDKIVWGGDRVGIYFLETGAVSRGSKVVYDRAHSAISEIESGMIDWDAVFDEGDITDGCDLPDNNLYLLDGDVLYNSTDDIAGFQFEVDGATVEGASGGDAAVAGFTVSSGGSTVLGFSFSAATIPAGCGTLTSLDLNGNATGLVDIIMSSSSGNALDFSYYEGGSDDGSCDDEDNDGICDDVDDCVGDYDDCGVCNGDGPNVECWDGSSACVATDCPNEPGDLVEILFDSDADIYGFQFNVAGAQILSVGGGAAAEAGFTVSNSASTVIGFSFAGDYIPSGDGV